MLVVGKPPVKPMTSLTHSTGVTVCHILTDFDVTHFQETQVLYSVKHMIGPYTRVYRHPLGQSCDRSTCHETHKNVGTHTQSVYMCYSTIYREHSVHKDK